MVLLCQDKRRNKKDCHVVPPRNDKPRTGEATAQRMSEALALNAVAYRKLQTWRKEAFGV
ncbi:hypothetical protein DVK85_07170 [Flavobacterium arcticum]|uniref:Uncharacterized protein n=1 Tax=Flavobacterium arcticum TaxID=1784713 RepID=A0A345HBS7_9FLAO|nr:hypothetical protein DVK85_07170 [Flavobacterium arcticum]